jgi:hypothetical protein
MMDSANRKLKKGPKSGIVRRLEMGILVECPSCKYRNGLKANACTGCGASIKKQGGKAYWIERPHSNATETSSRPELKIGTSRRI